MAKLRKINAVLGLLSAAALLAHVGYTVYAYLAFYYNPALKLWTAIPFIVLACLHAICAMAALFLQTDGMSLPLYSKQNRGTVLQRLSAVLILPLLILHLNTFDLLRAGAAAGKWLCFALLMLSQPLFYAAVLAHVAASLSRALVTLGWLSSRDTKRKLDRALYILAAVILAAATIAVCRTELAMFLSRGGAA